MTLPARTSCCVRGRRAMTDTERAGAAGEASSGALDRAGAGVEPSRVVAADVGVADGAGNRTDFQFNIIHLLAHDFTSGVSRTMLCHA